MSSRQGFGRSRASLGSLVSGILAGWAISVALWAGWLAFTFQTHNDLSTSDTLATFALWWSVFGVVAAPAVLLVVAMGVRRSRGCGFWSSTWAAAIACATALTCLNLFFRWSLAYRTFSPDRPALLIPYGALDLALLAGSGIALCWGASRWAQGLRATGISWICGAILALGAGHVANLAYEQPWHLDLSERLDDRIASVPCESPPTRASGLVLLALDGMTWNVAVPMIERGRMPHLERLLARSAYGHLDPLSPSYSPVVWATVATGLTESQHKVHGFLRMKLPGVDQPVSSGPRLNSFNWWGGTNRFLSILSSLDVVGVAPLPQSQREGVALWDVAGANGHSVGIYNWMNTWPVEAIDGYMFTSVGAPPRNAHPTEPVLKVIASAPDEGPQYGGTPLSKYPRLYSEAFHLYRTFEPTVSFHFNKVMDNMHDRWVGAGYVVRPLGPPYPPGMRFPDVVERSYELSDYWIGRFMDATPKGAVFAIVSDHGYDFDGTSHIFSPPGVAIFSGGPFACGRRIDEANVLDVAPTLLTALELPPSESMPGRVLAGAFAEGAPTGPDRIASYPAAWRRPVVSGDGDEAEGWQDLRDRLRALGYAN